MRSKLFLIAAVALAAGGCNRPPDVAAPDRTSSLLQPKESVESTALSTPPAPPERGPIPPDANAAAPGTDASLAFANNGAEAAKALPSNDNSPGGQHLAVAAEEAAAQAPDTAAADEAKHKAYEEYAGGRTPRDTLASAPVSTLTTREESREIPAAAQPDDRSNTSRDEPSTNSSPPSAPSS